MANNTFTKKRKRTFTCHETKIVFIDKHLLFTFELIPCKQSKYGGYSKFYQEKIPTQKCSV